MKLNVSICFQELPAVTNTGKVPSKEIVAVVRPANYKSSPASKSLDQKFIIKDNLEMSSTGNSTNIKWHECSIGKVEGQKLLKQRGCVIWITCLSASGLFLWFSVIFCFYCLAM